MGRPASGQPESHVKSSGIGHLAARIVIHHSSFTTQHNLFSINAEVTLGNQPVRCAQADRNPSDAVRLRTSRSCT
ncbi:hypothetical protein BCAR13_100057 [Paraburkholderia caribensis]|nr:hypothetical protein BCAR13_100057 [Paraburkholderia caribensis]